MAGKDTEAVHARIRSVVKSTPLVDGHGHNVVDLDSSIPFLQAFAEAERQALRDIPHTLPFKRSVDDIAGLYGIEANLESIEGHRRAAGLNAVCEQCFDAANICTLLLDDSLPLDKMKDLSWHKKYIYGVHRVLRIETLAEDVLNKGPPHSGVTWTLNSFEERFVEALRSFSSSVVGFKSIAAYRTGLDIDPAVSDRAAEEGLMEEIKKKKPYRLENRSILNFVFTRALELATLKELPMQIHTGFGDRDLDLKLANPLHLRAVLEDKRFATSRLVLLHASYPYMREAAYLSNVYPQVHLDFGLAVPKLSVRGMKAAIMELFELAPLNKVMFSTDGYAFPETYYLGAKWARNILSQVLCEAFSDGDISEDDAVAAARGILQSNALTFYRLDADTANFTHKSKAVSVVEGGAVSVVEAETEIPDPCPCHGQDIAHYRLLWADVAGIRRCRVVPTARYESVVLENGVGLAKCIMAMSSSTDAPAKNSGLNAVGEIRLIPDRTTERRIPWTWATHAFVLVDMHVIPGTPWEYCPRSTLRRLINVLDKEFGLSLEAGFESEFYLLEKTDGPQGWKGVDVTPYCSSNGYGAKADVLCEIVDILGQLRIPVEQHHAESGGGQFEISFPHAPALLAADNLLYAREAIVAISHRNAFLATFLPKLPFDISSAGSGGHVHLSLSKEGKNVFSGDSESTYGMSKTGEHFLAGVYHHLPAILAFTAPHPLSYKRIQPNTWSGAFHVWGHENREAPLRTASPPGVPDKVVSNFELKAFDGCANPHLGLAAVLAAGIDGLRKELQLPPPTEVNPAELEKGSVPRLPTKVSEAVQCLQEDDILKELLGIPLVTAACASRLADEEYFARFSAAKLLHIY